MHATGIRFQYLIIPGKQGTVIQFHSLTKQMYHSLSTLYTSWLWYILETVGFRRATC